MSWADVRSFLARFGLALFLGMLLATFLIAALGDGADPIAEQLFPFTMGMGALGFLLSLLGDNGHGEGGGDGGE